MDSTRVVMVALGVALLALTVLTRSPRSARRWGGSDAQERFAVVGLPCLAGVLVVAGLLPVLPAGVRPALALVAVLLCLAALAWGVFGLPLPRWAVPAHVRAARAGRRPTEAARRRDRTVAPRG